MFTMRYGSCSVRPSPNVRSIDIGIRLWANNGLSLSRSQVDNAIRANISGYSGTIFNGAKVTPWNFQYLPNVYRNSVSLPFSARYTRWMHEETLAGGRTTGAVLIDGVVHKRASPWTATVHAVLRHLEEAGFEAAPRALGFDDQGREMLTYLPGETVGDRDPGPAWTSADSMLAQVGQWLRRVHDLTADFTPPADEHWFIGGAVGPGLVVGHQDASPANAVVDGERLVGFCDWDIAGPSSREWDLALSALTWVPLASPFDGSPVSSHDLRERSRRLHLLLDAYGYDSDRQVFASVVPERARRQAGVIRRMADGGDAAATALLPIAGLLERSATDVEALPVAFWVP